MSDSSLRFGPVELRPQERRLLVNGQTQAVGARAFDILLALVERRERVVTKSELLELVWPGLVVEESNLPVHVSALRKTLGTAAIATIPGRGYRFTLASDPDAGAATNACAMARVGTPGQAPASSAPPAPAQSSGRFERALEADPLIGREEAVYDIVAGLLEHRLVNIVGAGGIGKTRLARAVQRRLREDFVDGVWWVDLAPVQHAEQVIRAVAMGLGEPVGTDDGLKALVRTVTHRHRMLLVLDNCEQATTGVVAVVTAMLSELPMLRLLLTSRAPLRLACERVWRLDPLPVPVIGATLDEARACGAFELFERRARASDQRFVIDPVQLPAAIEVCRRLEGHPLAIEMAAARASQLGLEPLLGRLGDRLRLLRANDPGQPGRQLNLRALLDWSFSQLDETQRAVLRRLSVFGGSFGLDAAQRVAADAELDEWDALDALAALVDHSLVQVLMQPSLAQPSSVTAAKVHDLPRYRLPETTRLYALEQLKVAGEDTPAQERLHQAMARLAEEASEAWWTMTQADWLHRFAADQGDLQAVFDAACTRRDAVVAGKTGQALLALDVVRGSAVGACERAVAPRSLLAAASDSHTRGLLWNLIAPAWSLEQAIDVATDDAASRVEAWQQDGDRRQLYLARRDLALALARIHRDDEAQVVAKAMRAIEDAAWSPALLFEGAQAYAELRPAGAIEAGNQWLLAGLQLAEKMGDARRIAWMRLQLAGWATVECPAQEAVRLGHQAVSAIEPLHRPIALGCAWRNLSAALLLAGDDTGGRQAAAEAYLLLQSTIHARDVLAHLALLEARAGNAVRAGQLLACADSAEQTPPAWGFQAVTTLLRNVAIEAIGPVCSLGPEPKLTADRVSELAWSVLYGEESFGTSQREEDGRRRCA
jgi:predicted ATPase/DNA-binding winged helix-turn-helix (wHTH) protein